MQARRSSRLSVCLVTSGALLAVSLLDACSTCHSTAEDGVDFVENTERSLASRTFAGFGAVLGLCVALPVTVILAPYYAFEGNAGQQAVVEPRSENRDANQGTGERPADVRMPFALAPVAYCRGVGAAVFGAPAAWIEGAICGPPERPADWLDEEPDRFPEEFPDGEPAAAVRKLAGTAPTAEVAPAEDVTPTESGTPTESDIPAARDGEAVSHATFSEHRAS